METVRNSSRSEMQDTRLGIVECHWVQGLSLTETVRDLWRTLDGSGFSVWVCSASFVWVVRAAVDAFGLHGLCSGIYGIDLRTDSRGRFVPEHNDRNCWHIATEQGWFEDGVAIGAVSKREGKVRAVSEGLVRRFGCGPCAGFCDSTGDLDFATAFSDMRLAVVFNRVLAPSDGGGLL